MNKLAPLLLLALTGAACSPPDNPMGWPFMQSVGGIAVGAPQWSQGQWQLVVRADVSGRQSITTQPTMLNSGLTCQSVRATVEGRAIYLTVMSAVAASGGTVACPPAPLGDLAPGRYAVYYRGPGESPVALGEVSLAR